MESREYMKFTQKQQEAIDNRNHNVLVSAAAGSGKTAVLSQRILHRITDKDHPVDIDHILVMTFTNAAAAEMRERIRKEIENAHNANPLDDNISKQEQLVHNACISTIHGFCQQVIRDHYLAINLDPSFRVGDDNECKLMKSDVCDAMLEEYYTESDEDFIRVVECLSAGKSDEELPKIIMNLYSFAQSYPDPDDFLARCVANYDFASEEEMVSSYWWNQMLDHLSQTADEAIKNSYRARNLSISDGASAKYAEFFEHEYKMIADLSKAQTYDEYRRILSYISFDRLPSVRKTDSSDEELTETIKNLRAIYKADVLAMASRCTSEVSEIYAQISAMKRITSCLTRLVKDFSQRFSMKKREKNIIDFNDMEHFCLQILADPLIASKYRDFYEEIYVDEYQDSNLTQEMILDAICRKEEGRANLFLVGDVKQSIYRFRLARPNLFLDKYEAYPQNPGMNHRIDLSDNFRSRLSVIDCINAVFSVNMTRENGKIEYDENAELHYGGLYEGKEDINLPESVSSKEELYKPELWMIQKDPELDDKRLQALAIGQRIRQMVGKYPVFDKKSETYRPMKYGDIAVLMRNLKGHAEVYRKVFDDMNIPVRVSCDQGYFDTLEVQVALSALSVIDNPRQDIPLMVVLKSFLCDFSDEEIVTLCTKYPGEHLYDSVLAASTEAEEKHAKDFIDQLNRYRKASKYKSVYDILSLIISGDFADRICLMDHGAQRMANLRMLLRKAEKYGMLSYKGIFHFIRYIEQIRKYEIDFGEASDESGDGDCVSIMTIHKSKGLEFPACFVTSLHKLRSKKDESKSVICDMDYGIGMDYIDPELRIRKGNLLKSVIAEHLADENSAEEMRVFYVALTRAREYLFMTAVTNDMQKDFYQKVGGESNSFLGLLSNAYRNGNLAGKMLVREVDVHDIVSQNVRDELSYRNRRDLLYRALFSGDVSEEDKLHMRAYLDDCIMEYEFTEDPNRPIKMSVSEIKKKSLAAQEDLQDNADLSPENSVDMYKAEEAIKRGRATKGALYGSAFHRMLEIWDYSYPQDQESVTQYFEKEFALGRMEAEWKDVVRYTDVVTFLQSPLAKRMQTASKQNLLKREQPFVIGQQSNPEEPMYLVQGIIDAYFEEDGEIVVVDYKTDAVSDEKDLIRRYKVQLDYYRDALMRLTGMNVKEEIIYSTRLKRSILIC